MTAYQNYVPFISIDEVELFFFTRLTQANWQFQFFFFHNVYILCGWLVYIEHFFELR